MLDKHLFEMHAMGFSAVCDLRSNRERGEAANDWCAGNTRLLDFEIMDDIRAETSKAWDSVRIDPNVEVARGAMCANYTEMPAAFAPHLRRMVEAILDGGTPVLIHCTAGKDRTGFAIAVILLALGVSREDVIAEYCLSGLYQGHIRIGRPLEEMFVEHFGFSASRETIEVLCGVQAAFIEAALREIDKLAGSFERYLDVTSGISASQSEALREIMLTPVGST